jgi:hypothetical protein
MVIQPEIQTVPSLTHATSQVQAITVSRLGSPNAAPK